MIFVRGITFYPCEETKEYSFGEIPPMFYYLSGSWRSGYPKSFIRRFSDSVSLSAFLDELAT